MQLSSPNPWFVSSLTWLIFFFHLCNLSNSADPRISEAGLLCGPRQPPNPNYIPLFVKEMEGISQLVTARGWGHNSANQTNNGTLLSIYALAHCYQDLPLQDCLLCYAASRTRLPRCLPSVSARLYLDGCFLRYDSYDFLNETVDPFKDSFNCSSAVGQATALELPGFRKAVAELLDNVTTAATADGDGSGGGGYAVGGWNGVYGLAQCWKTLSKEGCKQCLAKASREIKGCVPSREGRALNAGCYLRYSTQKFLADDAGNSTGTSGKLPTRHKLILAFYYYFFFLKKMKTYMFFSLKTCFGGSALQLAVVIAKK